MKRVVSVVLMAMLLLSLFAVPVSAATRLNNYPIVLIGGLGVWGRDEVLGFKYWGGLGDLQESLKAAGYNTVTAAPGPVSSYYDRACDVYAQILGRRADYGAGHAARYGHSRWGKDYTGKALLPNWGTSPAKVHLICHSMGGPTGRALVQLLEQGSALERNTSQSNMSPLFQGGKSWVRGVLTISSPHDGTTLTSLNYPLVGQVDGKWVQSVLAGWISLWSGGNFFYDWKLDQWGLTQQPGESGSAYNDRVMNSSIWTTTRDLANYDGSPEGAREFNTWVKAQPDVYYFSWATCATYREFFTGWQIPRLDMNPIWVTPLFANHMGSYTTNEAGRVPIDSSWWPNDGVVNTRSMKGSSMDTIVNYTGTPQIGKWNYLGLMDTWDHSDIIGITVWPVAGWYNDNASLLGSLPQ
ncbi:MAG: esterase/lipase family protein [Candidatus Saccharibacteria bacterium]